MYTPLHLKSQVVFPDETAIWHYKDSELRIRSFHIKQKSPVSGTNDSLYISSQDFVETGDFQFFAKTGKLSTGFPLGNELIRHTSGYWSSTLSDSTPLVWWFEHPDSTSWIVYADSLTQIHCVYLGNQQVNHFSRQLSIKAFRLEINGPDFPWLHNQLIWLSDYGILRSPDLRRYPEKMLQLRLAGYQSAHETVGISFNDSTFAPQKIQDTLAYLEHTIIPPNSYTKYRIHYLYTSLGSTTTIKKWVTDVIEYTRNSQGEYGNPTYLYNQNLLLPNVPVQNGLIPTLSGGFIYLVYDSLHLENNPDVSNYRTGVIAYGGNPQYYSYACNGSSVSTGHYSISWRSNWGYTSFVNSEKTGNNYCYNRTVESCIFMNLSGRRLWEPLPLSLDPTPENNPISIYPNPVLDKLHLNIDPVEVPQMYTLVLLNAFGKQVYRQSLALPYVVEMGTFPNGLYVLSLEDSHGYKIIRKLLKN